MEILRQMNKVQEIPDDITGCFYSHSDENRRMIRRIVAFVLKKSKINFERICRRLYEFSSRFANVPHANTVYVPVYYIDEKRYASGTIPILEISSIFDDTNMETIPRIPGRRIPERRAPIQSTEPEVDEVDALNQEIRRYREEFLSEEPPTHSKRATPALESTVWDGRLYSERWRETLFGGASSE